jgi:hypothetical protein
MLGGSRHMLAGKIDEVTQCYLFLSRFVNKPVVLILIYHTYIEEEKMKFLTI